MVGALLQYPVMESDAMTLRLSWIGLPAFVFFHFVYCSSSSFYPFQCVQLSSAAENRSWNRNRNLTSNNRLALC